MEPVLGSKTKKGPKRFDNNFETKVSMNSLITGRKTCDFGLFNSSLVHFDHEIACDN